MPQDSVTPRVSPPLPANIVFLSSPLSFFLSCAKQGALINQVLQEKSPQVSRGRSGTRHATCSWVGAVGHGTRGNWQ